MPAIFRRYSVGSPDYESAWNLRKSVLLDPFSIDHELARRDDSSALHLGLFEESECLACLMLVPRAQGVAQMRQVAVVPRLQRQQLGRLLTTHAEELARELGYEKIIAHARQPALPFYLALGYQAQGDAFDEVGIPHQMVAKSLLP